jgi:hypothetical protein
MVDLGKPLDTLVEARLWYFENPTLALTLSNEGGLTMEKQIRKTSV